MYAKEALRRRVFDKFKTNLIVGLITILSIGISTFDLIKSSEDQSLAIFSIIILIIASVILIFNIYFIIITSLDLRLLKQDKVNYMKIRLINDYNLKKNKRSNIKYLNIDTNEEIYLDIVGVLPNNNYKVMYLKYSKTGVAVEKLV